MTRTVSSSWKRMAFVFGALMCVMRNAMMTTYVSLEPTTLYQLDEELIHNRLLSATSSTLENRSFEYLQSIKSFQRTLQFLHIPKNAGSTIEVLIAARQAKLAWGMCRFLHRRAYYDRRKACFGIKPTWLRADKNQTNHTLAPQGVNLPWLGTPLWHTLPQLFKHEYNPYQNFDVFAVIRDPIDRAMSEYKYKCIALGKKSFIWMGPDLYYKRKLADLNGTTPALRKYTLDDGHLIPQHEYILRPFEVRQVDYVLNLSASSMGYEFNWTMQAFGLPLYWPGSSTRAENAVNGSALRTQNFNLDMENRLKAYYENDYKYLFS